MARITSVRIGSQLDDFVGELIASGRYGSASEVMRNAYCASLAGTTGKSAGCTA